LDPVFDSTHYGRLEPPAFGPGFCWAILMRREFGLRLDHACAPLRLRRTEKLATLAILPQKMLAAKSHGGEHSGQDFTIYKGFPIEFLLIYIQKGNS
jgi:hypothetical protein